MPAVAVVTDTTHYLPPELVEPEGIHLVSLYVNWPEGQQREAGLDFGAFYDRLRSAAQLPTTSQPSIGDFLAVYEPLLAEGKDIVSIHIAGGISGTVEAARQAARQAMENAGGGRRIEVIDSGTACGGFGLMALGAARVASGGGDLEATVAQANAVRDGLELWFAVDTLEYLQRGGRIGKAQAMLGSALKIKPILSMATEIVPVERVRTSGRAFERLLEYMRSRQAAGADGWVVQHIQAPDQAARIVERGWEIFGVEPMWVSEIGPVIGAHVGPGLLGVGGCARSLVLA